MTDSSPTNQHDRESEALTFEGRLPLDSGKPACKQTREARKMNRKLELFSIVLFALNAGVVGGAVSSLADEAGVEARIGELRGAVLSLLAPAGAVATETNPNYKGAAAPAPAAPPSPAAADWPSYNKTLTSERFSDLSQINSKNVAKLKVLCTYDTWRITSFETGLIMVEGALIGTTEFDIFSINPSTCAENWRTHEEYPAYILPTNRGAAYLDGKLFRGTDDGRGREKGRRRACGTDRLGGSGLHR
jgi:alcohol dehydrogenase (cytochrome c)